MMCRKTDEDRCSRQLMCYAFVAIIAGGIIASLDVALHNSIVS